ncbi:RELT-like protein 2 isoform X2 [Cynoglossus semilaevis]|uniref:RELT-like protein 2 isoform X2 n=1 Tax=Cynoglossus semilaevis TaxID=244447 RepID=UPI000497DFFB|nr:uncharacterized protein LOC103391476 isoform X2 [Cynoglossus semilaevis]
MTDLEASVVGEPPPSYIIFLVVFLFFLTGLSGFLLCHLLKRRGYRCRTGDVDSEEEEEEEEEEKKLGGAAEEEDEENQDTVEQILKCIIENEANMEAFNEMLGNRNVCVHHDPRFRKESIGSVPPHHHTVHSGTEHDSCHLCAQGRSKKGRRHSRTQRFKQRPGEQTVFSVGRFRVIHTDKKLHGSSTAVVGSGDPLDQSQDAEAGYNLRNMFKDVRPTSDTTNGFVPNMGKRRRSGTIFGLRRVSDPVGLRATEQSTSRQGGGLKFAFQKQPVVPEELVQGEDPEETEDEKVPHRETGRVSSLPSRRKRESQRSVSVSEPQLDRLVGPPAVAVPHSLTQGSADPGPVQTSTPTTAGFTSAPPKGFPVTQSPPDPCSSPEVEAGRGSSLAFISLGSSPQSSLQNRTPSSSSVSEAPSSPREVPRRQVVTSGRSSSLPPPGAAVISQSPTLSRSRARAPPPHLRSGPGSEETLGPCEGGPKKHFSEDRPPPSPGGRISSTVVVRGGADGQREFSVVTMVEDQDGSRTEAAVGLRQDKDDMVEMEDIRDCRVTQGRGEDGGEDGGVQEVLHR